MFSAHPLNRAAAVFPFAQGVAVATGNFAGEWMISSGTRLDSRASLCDEFLYFIENFSAYNGGMGVLYENLLQLTIVYFLLPRQGDRCVFLLNQ